MMEISCDQCGKDYRVDEKGFVIAHPNKQFFVISLFFIYPVKNTIH